MSPRNLAIAAVVLITAFLIELWPMSKSTGVLAFAEVQGQVEATKSVQYTETRQDKTHDNKSAPKTQTRVMILGPYLRRDDQKVLTAGDKLEGGRSWGARVGYHAISILDLETGKGISLIPESKLYRLDQTTYNLSSKDNSIKTEKVKPWQEWDFYKQLRSLPSDKAETLPERMIDGKRTLGYRFVEKDEQRFGTQQATETFTRDIWVDPHTKLPIRIEVTFRSTLRGQSDWVYSDIIWDAPLDRSLFSTTPPEGYKEAK